MEVKETPVQIATLLSKDDLVKSGKWYVQKRYLVAFLAFNGWIFMYLMRTNLSISIIEMTSNRSVTVGNETVIEVAELNSSSQEIGVILSAFSWGYAAAPLGALLVNRYGGVTTFGCGIALTGLLTMWTPFLIGWNLYAYLIARVFEGFFEGVSSTAFLEALRVWSAPEERSRLLGWSMSGFMCGTMLGYPICGTIAYYSSWKAVFYITGGASLVWYAIWCTLIRDYPEKDNIMTVQERRYLEQFNEYTRISEKKVTYPWIQIFTSKPVWAFWTNKFAAAWIESFIVYSLPLYIKDIHDIDIQNIGFLSGVPHICAVISIIGGSLLADYIRNRNLLSFSNVHKLYLTWAQILATVTLIAIAVSKNFTIIIILLGLFRLVFTINVVSHEVIPIDIGGQCCGLIMGFSTTALACGLALSPLVMGLIVTHHSAAEWSVYFFILSFLNVCSALIFYKFGSGELQSWAVPLKDTKTTMMSQTADFDTNSKA